MTIEVAAALNLGNCKEEFISVYMSKKEKPDMINHPPHYRKNGMECIDIIQGSLNPNEFIGYLKGTIIKYLYRYPDKTGLEDLEKAIWFIKKLEANKVTKLEDLNENDLARWEQQGDLL